MTDQHPLTDEIIEEIARFDPDADDMRAAYDLGFKEARKSDIKYVIRAFSEGHDKGSDDRLEKVIEWLKDNLGSSMYLQLVEDNVLGESGIEVNVDYVIQHLREEMRPL